MPVKRSWYEIWYRMQYRMRCGMLLVLCLVGVSMAGCTTITSESQSRRDSQQDSQEGQESFALRVLPVELSHPLELVYGPDGYLWITERTGQRITRVNPADGSSQVAATIPDVYQRANQDGLLGLVLHPQLLQGTGSDYVYVAYTYVDEAEDMSGGGSTTGPTMGPGVERRVRIRRYTYDPARGTLGEPFDLITDLPGSGDHNSGKLVFGVDEKLYYTIGDQGNNQFGNACRPILAQDMPTKAEVSASDWGKYPGKVLRLNLDGSIPDDNPILEGVQSHVFSYGHRNVQGFVMSSEGLLYGAEHGPKTDDEVNLIEAGQNYGWPHVAGYQDDQAYVYGNWSAAENCERLRYSDFVIPDDVPQQMESEWSHPDFTPPLYTFGTVPTDYEFANPACAPQEFICWPTIAPTGMELYVEQANGVPGWSTSLLATALKTGTVYRMALSTDGRSLSGEPIAYFKTTNRYRDIAIHPDGRTFYVITDNGNYTLGPDELPTAALEHPGTVLEFSYTGGG